MLLLYVLFICPCHNNAVSTLYMIYCYLWQLTFLSSQLSYISCIILIWFFFLFWETTQEGEFSLKKSKHYNQCRPMFLTLATGKHVIVKIIIQKLSQSSFFKKIFLRSVQNTEINFIEAYLECEFLSPS